MISKNRNLSDQDLLRSKAIGSATGFHSLSALTGDICNPNITNNLCVLLSCRDKIAVCAHLSPEQTFFFSAFTSCAPLVTCLVCAVKIKVNAHKCRRSLKNQSDSLVLLSFGSGWFLF